MAYLYGLLVVAVVSTIISVLYAAREVGFSAAYLFKLALMQALVAGIAVVLAVVLREWLDMTDLLELVVVGLSFSLAYWALNALFALETYQAASAELRPLAAKLRCKW